MTLLELQDAVYAELPRLSRTLAGRSVCDRIVHRAVARWPAVILSQCDGTQADVFGRHYARNLERQMRNEIGMGILLSLVLSAIISEIVKALIRRWMANRQEMLELMGKVA